MAELKRERFPNWKGLQQVLTFSSGFWDLDVYILCTSCLALHNKGEFLAHYAKC